MACSAPRLLKLLGPGVPRHPHDVLEVDTAALVAAHRPRIELSAINSGATFPLGPAPRGRDTFRSTEAFGAGWRRVVELTVHDAVPDLARFVRRVTAMKGATELGVMFDSGSGQMPVNNQSSARTMSSR